MWRSGSVGCWVRTADRQANVVGEGSRKLALHSSAVVEDGGHGAKGPVGDGMAVGPLHPGVERSDAQPVLADGRRHGVKLVDCVAGSEFFVGFALVSDRPVVAFDGGLGSLASAGEVVLGSF